MGAYFLPGSVLGGRETDMKDLEGINSFRGRSRALTMSYSVHLDRGGSRTHRKFTPDSHRPGTLPRRVTPGLSRKTEGQVPEGRCKAQLVRRAVHRRLRGVNGAHRLTDTEKSC